MCQQSFCLHIRQSQCRLENRAVSWQMDFKSLPFSRLLTSQLGLKISVKPMAFSSFFLISSVKPHVANHKNHSYMLGIHKSLSLSSLPIFRTPCYFPTRHFQENYIIFSLSCSVNTFQFLPRFSFLFPQNALCQL